MDPTARVRSTCAWVTDRAAHVHINAAALDRFTASLASTELSPPSWEEWHFCADAAVYGPSTAQYVLVLDAMNFCFWPSTTDFEYEQLATCLRSVLTKDPDAFNADRLSCVDADTLRSWFAPHDLPNIEERVFKLREVGQVLQAVFKGQAFELLVQAGGSAVEAVRLITAHFPGFRDEAVYDSRQIFLYKRAQILVGDLWAAYGCRRAAGGAGLSAAESMVNFRDLHSLTSFADYRIPQLLRAEGVLEYDAELAAAVDGKAELPAGGRMEVEIRACMVTAVERIREALQELKPRDTVSSVELDWLLWNAGEVQRDKLAPHHRVRTVFY